MGGRWEQLTPLERKLSVAVAVLFLLVVAGFATLQAVNRIQDLDFAILRAQRQLIKYAESLARSQSVDEAYVHIAAQHSSSWTEAEIHDRLRQEIYRLAMKKPPPVGAPFSPTNTNVLVSIPTLRQGNLRTTDEGYREYQLSFRIPGTSADNIFTFLERLQGSEQSLRIDGFQLVRSPNRESISGVVDVTRTVVDNASGVPSEQFAQFADRLAPALGEAVAEWKTEACEVATAMKYVTRGADCVQARAAQPGAVLYLREEFEPATTYDLYLDITALGPARIEVMDDDNETRYDGSLEVIPDGRARQYHVRFTVPGSGAAQATLRAPLVTLLDKGAVVYVDNVMLKQYTG